MKKKKTLQKTRSEKFHILQETELSYILRVIKTSFLIFLVLKDKNSRLFPQENPAGLHFSGVSFFTFRVFPFFTFLEYFHFSPFSGLPFFTFFRCFCVDTDLRELFLLSGVFYLTLLSLPYTSLPYTLYSF